MIQPVAPVVTIREPSSGVTLPTRGSILLDLRKKPTEAFVTSGALPSTQGEIRSLFYKAPPSPRLNEVVASLRGAELESYREAEEIIARRLEERLASGSITRLAYYRSKARMTQVDLAVRAGIPQPSISKLERTGRVSLRMAERIAPVLAISVAELLGLGDKR